MKSDSIRLAWAGALIGVLALSAAAAARLRPPAAWPGAQTEPEGLLALETQSGQPGSRGEKADAFEENGAAIPVMAEQTEARQGEELRFTAALRVESPAPGKRLFLCDEAGCPLEELSPDPEGDAALGPLAPGVYLICEGQTELGRFRLLDNAALEGAAGQLWTDGERLYLERFVPGAVRVNLILSHPGYYAFQLLDRDGRTRTRDLFIPDSEPPGTDRSYRRELEFPGLPPGLYTLARQGEPLGQLEVSAGETGSLQLTIDK